MKPARVLAVIPSRFASTRLPGKPLAEILGHPMIEWVYAGVCDSELIDELVVATDDPRIIDAVRAFGGVAELTSTEHQSGTDRVAEVAKRHEADIVVNIQGDEPLVTGSVVDAVISTLDDPRADIATPITPMSGEQVLNPGIVKVVTDSEGFALYFSRSPIPYVRDARPGPGSDAVYWKHLGIYAYRSAALDAFVRLPPGDLERAESLEQLRAFQAGMRIKTAQLDATLISVDYPQDLVLVENEARERGVALPDVATASRRRNGKTRSVHASLREIFAKTKLIICDCDGVLTDGRLIYDGSGGELKAFHVRDGMAAALLRRAGIKLAIVSGRESAALQARAYELGIELVITSAQDKGQTYRAVVDSLGLADANVAVIGDDLPDLVMFELAGLSFAPADAAPAVKARADYVCQANGGEGVLREVVDMLLSEGAHGSR